MYRNALLLSITIHIFLSLLITGGNSSGEGDGKHKGRPNKNINVKIIDKPSEEENKEPPLPPKSKSKIKIAKKKEPKKKAPPVECKDWYGGIGINQNFIDQVLIVHPGYPAYKAGIKSGDKIISPEMSEIRGEPGTKVTIVIDRDGQILTFNLIRDKICTDKLQKE